MRGRAPLTVTASGEAEFEQVETKEGPTGRWNKQGKGMALAGEA